MPNFLFLIPLGFELHKALGGGSHFFSIRRPGKIQNTLGKKRNLHFCAPPGPNLRRLHVWFSWLPWLGNYLWFVVLQMPYLITKPQPDTKPTRFFFYFIRCFKKILLRS